MVPPHFTNITLKTPDNVQSPPKVTILNVLHRHLAIHTQYDTQIFTSHSITLLFNTVLYSYL